MTDLTACYFCGTAEAAEEGPAVPPAFDPPTAVQQSVVLCPACREKLTAVLEPVFEEDAGATPATGAPTTTGAPNTTDAPGDGGASGFEAFDAATGATDAAGPDAPDDDIDRIPESERNPSEPERGTSDPDTEGDDPPEQYYTVLRFLENREFPVPREEIARVVAGAYDLSEREVGEIVDAAVQRGVLVEEDGRLARSRDRL